MSKCSNGYRGYTSYNVISMAFWSIRFMWWFIQFHFWFIFRKFAIFTFGCSTHFTPVKVYHYTDGCQKSTLKENRGKSGVYRWTNIDNSKTYVGSAVDLSKRLRQYYSPGFLRKELLKNNSVVYKALLKYGYSNFRLEILEYCEAKDAIKREQYYIDLLKPTYNICKIAGSSLGRVTSNVTRRRLRDARLLREYDRDSHLEETIFEFRLRKVEQKILELESVVTRLRGTLEKLRLVKPKSKVSLATRQKILASSLTAQAVEVTDLVTGQTTTYLSSRRAAEAINASANTIMNRLKGIHTLPYKGRYLIKASTSDSNNAS